MLLLSVHCLSIIGKFRSKRHTHETHLGIAPGAGIRVPETLSCGNGCRRPESSDRIGCGPCGRQCIGAARRLGLSSSAMSRTLERLRRATGDPLLVRAGRGLVPTPHAAALRDRVHLLSLEARSVLRPSLANFGLAALSLTFTIRAGEWFMEMLSTAVVQEITQTAPNVRICFVPKRDSDPELLWKRIRRFRDWETRTSAPEIRTHFLFRDKHVGVARSGHPLLASGKVTPRPYAACRHVAVSQVGDFSSPTDAVLEELQLSRTVQVVVPGFPDAMRIAASSDLIGLVPHASLGNTLIRDRVATMGLQQFEIPVHTPELLISALWHPRVDADPAQRWLRQVVISVCKGAYPVA